MILNNRYLLFLLFLFVYGYAGAQGSKKKTGFMGKAYHDITARNNTYFNGNEKMKAIQRAMRAGHKDDFSQIIPIYTDRNPEAGKSAGADLDEIIKKASKIIKKHEPAKWADDAYMILGKSYYFKGDFDNSVKSFQYVLTNYKIKKKKGASSSSSSKGKSSSGSSSKSSSASNSSGSKSKTPMTAAQKKAALEAAAAEEAKEKEEKIETVKTEEEKTGFNEEKYFKETFKQKFRHKPAYYNAYIWLADNYTFMGKYDEAQAVFTVLDSRKGKFPFRLSDELETSRANMYLMKKDYGKAKESLTLLTKMVKNNKKKNRYHYILAQLHENDKNYTEAVDNYKESLKGRPPYDMQFAAQISIGRIGVSENSLSAGEVRKILNKLAKDEKNKDFLDQVYYYLAKVCLSENDKKCAIENLKKSVAASTNNNKQKAISHLMLADLYFEDEEYRPAQENYAAAVALLDDKYPGFKEYKYRSEILSELVKQLDIIYEQDSLLRIASLPEKERNKFIDDLIYEMEKAEKAEKEKTEQLAAMPAEKPKQSETETSSGGSKSDWYFYNPALKGTGYNDFIKIWGAKRKLEDNWRRSNKSAALFDNATAETDTTSEVESTSPTREAMLKNFPLTKAAREKSEEMLLAALYEAATIYKAKLNNNEKAILSFEEILVRFPTNKYQSQIYYNLYLLYKDQGNTVKSDYYKNLLLDKFPDSQYAKVILDPEYLTRQGKKNEQVDNYYKTTYSYYQQGSYDTVLMLASNVDSLFKENYLKPKFALLNAFAIGKTKDLKSYKEALNGIVENYPGDEVKTKAEEILSLLSSSDTKEVQIQNAVSDFDFLPDDAHYFMITYSSDSIKSSELNNAIGKYNDLNRSLEDLKVNTLILKDNITMIAVKSFRNMAMAKDYLGAIVTGNTFGNYAPGALSFSIISENNFNVIIRHRELESYMLFYESRYTK